MCNHLIHRIVCALGVCPASCERQECISREQQRMASVTLINDERLSSLVWL